MYQGQLPPGQGQGQGPYAPGPGPDLRQRANPAPMAYGATGSAAPQLGTPMQAAPLPKASPYGYAAGPGPSQPRLVQQQGSPQARRGGPVSQSRVMPPVQLPPQPRVQQPGPPPPMSHVGSGMEESALMPKMVPLNKNMFLAMGLILLAMLCFLPIWDSIDMLHNITFAFWIQRGLPITVIVVSCLIILFFFFTTEAFFGRWKNELHTTQSLVVMASLFITLLGLLLVLVSLPLSQKAIETHNDIVYQCGNTEATRSLRDYYLGLLRLRRQPECQAQYSIEDCEGYHEEKPYADYLKAMEKSFRCSGFCYEQTSPAMAGLQMDQANMARVNMTAAAKRRRVNILRARLKAGNEPLTYPPTLFSLANFEASCDGAAARNLINFARDTGYQMWYNGVVLIAMSICMGLWEWTSSFTK